MQTAVQRIEAPRGSLHRVLRSRRSTVMLASLAGWLCTVGAAGSARTHVAPAGGAVRKCPDLHGQFMFPGRGASAFPGNGLITIEQEGCRKITYRDADGNALTLRVDNHPRKTAGDDGRVLIRTAAWRGAAAHLEERLYAQDGTYVSKGSSDVAINEDNDIAIYTRTYAIIDNKEVPAGNPIVQVARRVRATRTPR
jgi:hypothetical protein